MSDFLHFQIVEKWANLRVSLNVQKPKVLQLQKGFAPPPELPDQGLCPWATLVALFQIPVIGSRYRARYGAVPL